MAFITATGVPVNTVVDANGEYKLLPAGERFGIRYDPGSPTHAQLPGAPTRTLTSTLLITGVTIFFLATLLVGWRRRQGRHEDALAA
ncbi:MAG TPA: hypothetical protein VG275_05215 [Solirubrobacteraceae bacterium]|nr:hypothetical protein [Solirubrobacteraceae bacterium]